MGKEKEVDNAIEAFGTVEMYPAFARDAPLFGNKRVARDRSYCST